MYRLGIDPGCTVTGWAISHNHIIKEHGPIRTNGKMSFLEKIYFISDKMEIILNEHDITEAAIEDSYVNMKNPYSSLKLSTLRGALIALLYKKNIIIHLFTPTQIKKLISKNGHASKNQIKQSIYEITGFDIKSQDVNDAIATCLCLKKQI